MSRKSATAVQTRFDDELLDRIEEFRRSHRIAPPLADAVRQLVELGLDAKEKELAAA